MKHRKYKQENKLVDHQKTLQTLLSELYPVTVISSEHVSGTDGQAGTDRNSEFLILMFNEKNADLSIFLYQQPEETHHKGGNLINLVRDSGTLLGVS